MSNKALTWAFEAEGLSTIQKFLLVALADFADESNSCYPGQDKLARMVGASRETVSRNLRVLVEAGFISRSYRRRSDGFRTSDRFVLNLSISCDATSRDSGSRDANSRDSDETSCDANTPPHVTQTGGQEPLEEPLVDPSVAATPQKASPKRGTRIPDLFPVTPEMRSWSAANTPGLDPDAVTARFVDYWRGAPGQKGVKADWYATWRNWMRKASDEMGAPVAPKRRFQAYAD